MGTRHYIQIQLNNEYRLEQYGQWDGYMSGVGVDVIIFLKKLISNNLINDFVDKVSKLKSFTDEELGDLDVYNGANLYARFPHEMIGLMRF